MTGFMTVAYLCAGVLFIRSLGGLSKQETAQQGNLFGMIGMTLAVIVAGLSWVLSTPSDGVNGFAMLGAAIT